MKKIGWIAKLTAAACVLVSSAAHANRWNFVFHDLHHVYEDLTTEEVTDYGYLSLDGYFIADDLNHDGQINLSEVQLVSLGGTDFAKSGGEITAFSYSGGNALSVTAYGYRTVLSDTGGLSYGSGGFVDSFRINANSFITVSAAPVPELSSASLLGAGLIAIGGLIGARRRHARKQVL